MDLLVSALLFIFKDTKIFIAISNWKKIKTVSLIKNKLLERALIARLSQACQED